MNSMIDAHIHLTHGQYAEDLDKVILQCKDNNISKLVLIGCDKQEIIASLELAKKYLGYIYVAVGFHPLEVDNVTDKDLEWLKEIITDNDNVIALGEIGLDYYYHPEKSDIQKELFKKQIRIAKELDIPIIIHSRESSDDCFSVLVEEDYFKGIMHSFADDYQSGKRFIDKGMYISISGPVTFKNGHNQKDMVKNMDITKLLIETDGPYLTPAPNRGKRNHPMYLDYIVDEISSLRKIDKEKLKEQLLNNAYTILKELND